MSYIVEAARSQIVRTASKAALKGEGVKCSVPLQGWATRRNAEGGRGV